MGGGVVGKVRSSECGDITSIFFLFEPLICLPALASTSCSLTLSS